MIADLLLMAILAIICEIYMQKMVIITIHVVEIASSFKCVPSQFWNAVHAKLNAEDKSKACQNGT